MAKHTPPRALMAGAAAFPVLAQVAQDRPLEFKSAGGESEREFVQLARDLKVALDETKRQGEKSEGEIKSLGQITNETKLAADKALTEQNAIIARLGDLEQKMARDPGGSAAPELKTMGEKFLASEEVKAMIAQGDRFHGKVAVEVKNITSASAAAGEDVSTGLVIADRQPGVVLVQPNRRLVIRDLLMAGRTSSNAIEWVRETLFTNSAATVAENPSNPKPQSDLTFDLQNTPVRAIAHFVMASKQIMGDAPMLQSYIDGRLRYGLGFYEDNQLLNGNGTGTNLSGLMQNATDFAVPAGFNVAKASYIDVLRVAMLQATLALYPATGHILNPTDWAAIETTKDSQGRYIWANPANLNGPVIWGLPVAESLAMAPGSFMTGAFKYAAQIFDREDANVLLSTEDRDNFVKNMITILCEERLALAVYRPQALIKGAFGAGVTALTPAP